MKRAKKLRRMTGMIVSMCIVILSFFPIVRAEGGNMNIIQLVTHERFEFSVVSGVLMAAYLFTPIMSLVNYSAYLSKKEGIGKMILSVYISIFGLLSVIGIGGYCELLEIFSPKMPGLTIWVIIRFFFGFFDGINRMSGEELFERILKVRS